MTQLSPENGGAWTFRGLCDYQLKNYDDALTFLVRGRSLGIGQNKQLVSVARYHTGILLTRMEQFEQSLGILRDFAIEGDDGPRIIEAMGIAVLRMPILPADVPGTKREMVMLAGRAAYFTAARFVAAAQKAFEELVMRYPETPHVHYAYGVFLTAESPDAAVEQYLAELKVSPRHPWAKMQLAYEYIRRAEWDKARPWAEQAVEEAPHVFVAHRALGQVLLETGDVEGAIREFEAGVKMASDSPAMRFALARAYRRAGRNDDAQREQAEFTQTRPHSSKPAVWSAIGGWHRARQRRDQPSDTPIDGNVMRQPFHWIAGLVAIALALTSTSHAQKASAQQASSPGGEVTAILVDVVVRDKNGNPIADLRPDEFEVIEDGVRQQVGAFTPIFRPSPDTATAAALPSTGVTSTAAAVAPDVSGSMPGAAAAAAAANTPIRRYWRSSSTASGPSLERTRTRRR